MTTPSELRQAWACDHCALAGSTRHPASEDSASILDRIEEAHAIASLDCHEKHGAAGIRLDAASLTDPNSTLWQAGPSKTGATGLDPSSAPPRACRGTGNGEPSIAPTTEPIGARQPSAGPLWNEGVLR